MTDAAAAILDLLARYDDDALTALASRGLLRRARKDVETSTPQVRVEDAEVVVATGGHVVRFGPTGAVGARCTCPAITTCQHVLAAVLAAAASVARDTPSPQADQQTANAVTSSGTPEQRGAQDAATASSNPGDDTSSSPADELCTLSSTILLAHAGVAGYRWAWQLVEDLEAADGIRVEVGRAVVIRFARPALTFRYLGGPIDAVVMDAPPRHVDRYRVAAVLAYQRARGLSPAPPPPPRTRGPGPAQSGLNLGRDLGHEGTLAEQRGRARRRVRTAVAALAADCVELGLAHLSPAVQERFTALAHSARAADYHRLALLLRRIADDVELLGERHAGADASRLLDEIALVAALVAALDDAAARGTEPAALVGRARGGYDASGTLELIGLGAQPWRSPSGYVGLTVMFLSPATGTFLSWTDARPVSVGGLDPVARYRSGGPWTGLASPAAATGRRILLTGAKVSDTGRLSGSESTTAALAPITDDLASLLAPHHRWSQLTSRSAAARRSLLAVPDPSADWVVLAPSRFGEAVFDHNQQALEWPLVDVDGALLLARIPHQALTTAAITRIEQLSDRTAPGTLLVARLAPTPGGLTADPLSVVHPTADADGLQIETLALPAPHSPTGPAPATPTPTHPTSSTTRDRAADRPRPPREEADPDDTPSGPPDDPFAPATPGVLGLAPTPVRSLRTWLQRTAERGLSPAALPTVTADLQRLLDHAVSAGLTAFGTLDRPVSDQRDLAGRLLRTHALCLQHEHLAARPGS